MSGESFVLIYDGECPVCSAYVRLVRLREAVGDVSLIDARQGGPVVEEMRGKGIDLDDGMVALYRGRLYHGSDCIHLLALMSSPVGPFNRMNVWLFKNAAVARACYPVLRCGRNLLLKMLGRARLRGSLEA